MKPMISAALVLSLSGCLESPPEELGTNASNLMSAPALVPGSTGSYMGVALSSWGPNRLDLFYVANDHSLGHKWSTNGGASWYQDRSWGGWISWPSAVSWGV